MKMTSTLDIELSTGSEHNTCESTLQQSCNNKALSTDFGNKLHCETRSNSCCSVDERSLLLHNNHHQNNYAFTNNLFCQKWQTDNFLFHHNPCSSLQYLFSRLQPLKVLLFTFCLLFLFILCVESAPPHKNYSTQIQSQSIPTNLSPELELHPRVLRRYEVTTIGPRIKKDIYRVKRSSTDGESNSKKAGKTKSRKTRRSKPSNEKKKKKRKRKARRRTRKNGSKTSLTKNFMHSIPDSRRRLTWSSPRWQRLYNSNGNSFHLAVWPNGTVGGEPSNTESTYSILELRALEGGGVVTIKGYASKRYICVIKKRVKAKKRFNRARCQFKERVLPNSQNTYESLSCKNCFLNLNKHGKIKKLNGVKPQLPRAHFLPRDQQRRGSRFLEARRESEVSIDFSKLNETELTAEKLESFLDPEKDGVVNRKYSRLITEKETAKSEANPEKSKFLSHSKLKNWSPHLQKATDNQAVNVRKIKIKTAAKID